MNTSSLGSHRRRALGAVISASLFFLGNAARADLPASGSGWTLAGTDSAWALHSDVESAQAYSGATDNHTWTFQAKGSLSSISSATDIAGGTLTPQSGAHFYVASIGSTSENYGLAIVFDGVALAAGTYTVSFDIAGINGKTFATPGYVNLTADVNDDGKYSYTERLAAASSDKPSPADGGWQTWTYLFDVTNETVVNSSIASGHDLGFIIQGSTANSGFAFDNFTISYAAAAAIPEPAAAALLAGGVLLAAVGIWRRGRR